MVKATSPRRGKHFGVSVGVISLLGAAPVGLGGCGSASNGSLYGEDFTPLPPPSADAGSGQALPGPDVPVSLRLATPGLTELSEQLALERAKDAAAVRSEHPLTFASSLGYTR